MSVGDSSEKSEKSSLVYGIKTFEDLYNVAHDMFKDTKDIFSDKGVSRACLVQSMQLISLATHHDIMMTHNNGHSIIFYCAKAGDPTVTVQKEEDAIVGTTEPSEKGEKQHEVKKDCSFFFISE